MTSMIFLAHICSYSTKTHMPQCIHTYVTAIHPSSSQSSVIKPQQPHIFTLCFSKFLPLLSSLSLTHTHTSSTKLLEPLACQGGKMALQPSSQSDSLARTGDHRTADPALWLPSSPALLETFGPASPWERHWSAAETDNERCLLHDLGLCDYVFLMKMIAGKQLVVHQRPISI